MTRCAAGARGLLRRSVQGLGLFAGLTAVALAGCAADPAPDDDETSEHDLSAFVCDRPSVYKDVPSAPYGKVVAVRAAGHDGFDRFVMEFSADSGVPNWVVSRQRGATFFQDGSGDPISTPGAAGIEVGVHMASGWDWETSAPSYTGPDRFRPLGARIMTEAVSTGDFEGLVGWGVGLQRSACYRVFELSNPPRLVVDVQNDGPEPPLPPPPPPSTEFQCSTAEIAQSSSSAPYGKLVGVRAAGHPEYDRFVMEFARDSGVPNFSVRLRGDATFTGPGEDASFTLPGHAGLDVLLQGASGWDHEHGAPLYTGPESITPGGASIVTAARRYEDFEGYVGWGLGLQYASCYRAFTLADPPRLVVDVMH